MTSLIRANIVQGAAPQGRETASDATTRLLACGVAAGPLFFVASYLQAFTRSGFDLNRHAISMLLLGDRGWMQLLNFEVSGLLFIAFAVGVRRLLRGSAGGIWGPRLIAVFGAGLVAGGLFGPDPAFGFPPGAPEGMPAAMSAHGAVHAAAFFIGVLSLVAACFVFRRRFAALRQPGWATFCAVTGVVAPATIILSGVLTQSGHSAVPLAVLALAIAGWPAALALRLLADRL